MPNPKRVIPTKHDKLSERLFDDLFSYGQSTSLTALCETADAPAALCAHTTQNDAVSPAHKENQNGT